MDDHDNHATASYFAQIALNCHTIVIKLNLAGVYLLTLPAHNIGDWIFSIWFHN